MTHKQLVLPVLEQVSVVEPLAESSVVKRPRNVPLVHPVPGHPYQPEVVQGVRSVSEEPHEVDVGEGRVYRPHVLARTVRGGREASLERVFRSLDQWGSPGPYPRPSRTNVSRH